MSQLMNDRRFFPFFWTQFLGAFTDNVFKNAFVVLLVATSIDEGSGGMSVTLASGLFILPFFLFSPLAGQISDKYSKSSLIRIIKAVEIAIMALAAAAFYLNLQTALFFILFLMGTQSTFFGPLKFSILPQTLKTEEMMKGTGLVEMGTFLAILLGTVLGGWLAPVDPNGWQLPAVCAALLTFSVGGFLISTQIPKLPGSMPSMKINLNPIQEFRDLYRLMREKKSVFHSIIGISWFWFFGASILSLFPNLVKFIFNGDEGLITLMLAMFTLSIGIGSALCEKLSHTDVEIGLVPFGSLGMTVFAFHLGLSDYSAFASLKDVDIPMFLATQGSYLILLDLFMIGFFGSFFIVPLYALIQTRTPIESCSRMIAANNIANAVFMVASSLMSMLLFAVGLDTIGIFLVLAILNLIVGIYILAIVPEFFMRFVVWMLAKTIYRLRYVGRENIPTEGPAIVVANHVSFIDWFIVAAACQRPVRFIMHYSFYKIPFVKIIFDACGVIPIAQEKEDPEVKAAAFDKVSEALSNGDILCLFPEGAITSDGELDQFRGGVEKFIERNPVPVIPICITGLWGSFFSRSKGGALRGLPKPSMRKINVEIGQAIAPEEANAGSLQKIIQLMLLNPKTRDHDKK